MMNYSSEIKSTATTMNERTNEPTNRRTNEPTNEQTTRMVSYSMALLRRRRLVDASIVLLANAIVAGGAMLMIRSAMLCSEQTQNPDTAVTTAHGASQEIDVGFAEPRIGSPQD